MSQGATMADVDQARELQRLRAWKREAVELFDGLQDLGRVLDLPLGTLVTGPTAVAAARRLREKVKRVESLDLTSRRLGMAFPDPERLGWNRALAVCADDVAAALRGPDAGEED